MSPDKRLKHPSILGGAPIVSPQDLLICRGQFRYHPRMAHRWSKSKDKSVEMQPAPDHAWKLLSLVNEWIRHSDAKAGVTLAFTGFLGTALFNLVRDFTERSLLFDIVVVLGCASLLATAALCGLTLTPRINDRDADPEAINRLFFSSITKHFAGQRPRYKEVLSTLTADSAELIADLADQIHANAKIATLKARWVKWAMRAALVAGGCTGLTAALIGIERL